MRSTFFPNGVKPYGIIIKKTHTSLQKQQPQQISFDPTPNLATITSNTSSPKVPGQMRADSKPKPPQMDEQIYYNADVYSHLQKPKEQLSYVQVEHLAMPIKVRSKSLKNEPIQKFQSNQPIKPLQSIQEQNINIINTHKEFQLQKYSQISILFRNMGASYNQNEVQFLNNVKSYLQLVTKANISQASCLRVSPNKRQIIKAVFVCERQAIVVICFTIITKSYEKCKNYCLNLLKYIFDNYLVVLNLLTHEESPSVLKMIKDLDKQFLLGKNCQFLRTNKEIINDLINKVVRIDPLFAVEYFKMIQSFSGMQIKFVFNALLTLFAFYINAIKTHDIIPFMACAPGPFILQKPTHQYTLVIDFFKVFLNQAKPSKKQRKGSKQVLALRPYATYFLKQMSKYFEIVSFSNSMPIECNNIVSTIDGNSFVKHRLYKYHFEMNGRKEMSKIGRDLRKMILIDTVQDQANKNLLLVSSWKGEESNVQLAQICPLLALIVVKQLDVLASLEKIRQNIKSNSELGLKYINCGLNL